MKADSPERLTFIPDIHAREDLLRASVGYSEKIGSVAVFLGDVTDGPGDELECLRIYQDNTDPNVGNALLGNHDVWRIQVISAALRLDSNSSEADEFLDNTLIELWLAAPSLGGQALRSYGIDGRVYKDPVSRILKLHELMEIEGLFSYLTTLKPFYEDDRFIAIHAGLPDYPWWRQKRFLTAHVNKLKRGKYVTDAVQFNSFELAKQEEAFAVTDKTVITGHMPLKFQEQGRVTADGKRVRLDSYIKNPENTNIFVFDSVGEDVVLVSSN